MAGWTNKGKMRLLETIRGAALPTNFYCMLCTSADAPDADSNTVGGAGGVTEVSTGNGYSTGGISLTKNATDFDEISEDDSGNLGSLKIRDLVWTASGGTLPASDSARYAVITDDAATVADREIWFFFDLASDRQVSSGQTLTLADCDIRLTES